MAKPIFHFKKNPQQQLSDGLFFIRSEQVLETKRLITSLTL